MENQRKMRLEGKQRGGTEKDENVLGLVGSPTAARKAETRGRTHQDRSDGLKCPNVAEMEPPASNKGFMEL